MMRGNRSSQPHGSHAGHVRAGGGAVGVAWYPRQHWDALRDMFVDGSEFEDTYDEWLEGAQAMEEQLKAEGKSVVRVDLDPDVFRRWCETKGLAMNAQARTRFAVEGAKGK